MKRTLAFSATLALGMVSSVAFAAPRATYRWVDESKIGSIWVPPPKESVSNVIYLNNCKPNGCPITAGGWNNDATTNTSSIPDNNTTISAYSGGDANWQKIVDCVKATYADFDVQIVTSRPTSGSYHMAIVAGLPNQVGEDSQTAGVSPFGCSYIGNAISYSFANLQPSNIADICWTVSQETAHSWGLDHKYDNRDPMTYLSGGPATKRFQNEAGSCGEYSARGCQCNYATTGSTKMNSYALIKSVFGLNTPDVTPPSVQITLPAEGAQVGAGFAIRAHATDDRTVQKVEFRLDGTLYTTLTEDSAGTWPFQAPVNIGQGKHKVELTAYDRAGNTAKSTVNVMFGTPCAQDSECTAAGQVCLDSHCVAGPGLDGGLGANCGGNGDCASGSCASDDGGHSYCVEGCDPSAGGCPTGFGCTETGPGTGVCWPDSGGGGGCSTGDGNGSVLFLALGLVGLLISRKKR